ncbi:MAG: hypothetical protein GY795_11425 [Desulfobacterales bacterium]|nr:hypothetical protein [Desulfobacterales bacterium]
MLTTADIPELTDDQLAVATDEELQEWADLLERLSDEWVYTERQAKATEMAGKVRELLYGGAAGGGKSNWIVHYLYDLALEYPGFKALALRKTFPELWRSLIQESLQRYDRRYCKFTAGKYAWTFSNGSIIEFGHLDKRPDVYKYDSAEYDVVAWDELTQWADPFEYTYLFSRNRTNRQKRALGLRPHIIAGTTPSRVGNLWVRERFVDIGPAEELHIVDLDDPDVPAELRHTTRAFVPAKADDNPFNDPTYWLSLSNIPDPAIRKAYRDGSWDTIQGQFFDEWDRKAHVVRPFPIPEWWTRFRGYDYGYSNPTCVLWFAVNGDGDHFVYREWYKTKITPDVQAGKIVALSRRPLEERGDSTVPEDISYTAADPSIWTQTGIGPPIAQQLQDAGLYGLQRANNARVDGWVRVRSYLRVDERRDPPRPRLFIFDTCRNLVRTLPMLVRDEDNPEDLDTDGEDHAADSLRYALMSRPAVSLPPAPPERGKTDEDRMQDRIQRHRRKHAKMHPDLGRL